MSQENSKMLIRQSNYKKKKWNYVQVGCCGGYRPRPILTNIINVYKSNQNNKKRESYLFDQWAEDTRRTTPTGIELARTGQLVCKVGVHLSLVLVSRSHHQPWNGRGQQRRLLSISLFYTFLFLNQKKKRRNHFSCCSREGGNSTATVALTRPCAGTERFRTGATSTRLAGSVRFTEPKSEKASQQPSKSERIRNKKKTKLDKKIKYKGKCH